MPDLVAKLSGLHATLTTRLTLQESLLSLSGRLDMVLSQIEMRSSTALAPHKGMTRSSNPEKKVNRYVEGESENDSDDMAVEVEQGSGDDGGSIEDVELGGDSQGEESSEGEKSEVDEGSEEESGEEDSDNEGPTTNGFIDDEAEEYSGEEEEEDSE
jgi:U3 small nucleolar RNA-associated protein 5